MAPPDALAEARFRRDCVALHRLGPRAMAEFLAELAADRMARTAVEEMLRSYTRRLSPEMLAGIGGDRFPNVPLRAVAGGRR